MSLATWQARAIERAARLKIHQSVSLASSDLLIGALGQDWLNEQERLALRLPRNIADAKPLYRHLISSSDNAIVTVCELARYLREFASDPAISTIVSDLRSDKFESTFLELALAHRWKIAGASVLLQPPVPAGVADFAAVIDGIRFVVEASTFPADDFSTAQFRAAKITVEAVESVVKNRLPVAVKLIINEDAAGDFEGNLRKAVKESCVGLLSTFRGGEAHVHSNDFGFCSIHVERITESTEAVTDPIGTPAPLLAPRWSVSMSKSSIQKPSGAFDYQFIEGSEGPETVRVFVRYPQPSQETLSQKIANKLRKEKRQLKGVEAPRVVILDVTAPAKAGMNIVTGELSAELTRLMENTPELTGVWLLSTLFPARLRHEYYGPFIPNGRSSIKLPHEFLSRLDEQEGAFDFINNVDHRAIPPRAV